MTESPGPGWWLSTNGQWRPPEEHPDFRRPTGAPEPDSGQPRSGPARRPDLSVRSTHLGSGSRRDLGAGGTLVAERPSVAEPVLPAPVVADPVLAEPVAPEPVEPELVEPVEAEPEPAEPVEAEPEPAEPVEAEPEPAEAVEAEPEPAEAALLDIAEPDVAEPAPADTASALLPITLPDETEPDAGPDAAELLPILDPTDSPSGLIDQPDETDFWAGVRDEASAAAPTPPEPAEVERFDATGESVSPTQAPTPEPTDEPFPEEAEADRRGISLVSFLVLIALAAAGTAYYLYFIREPESIVTPTTEQPANSVFALDVGSCVGTEPVQLDQPLSVIDLVPCTEPHSAEVFDVANSPNGEFDATAIREFATKICAASLEEIFGVAYEDAPVDFFLINPSEASWAANDRSSLCLAYRPNATLAAPLADLSDG